MNSKKLVSPLIKTEEKEDTGIKIDFASYISETAPPSQSLTSPPAKKRGRPPKAKTPESGTILLANQDQQELSMLQSNAPYLQSYGETNMLLRGSIGDIDRLNSIVGTELSNVVESKTLRKKYDYVSELSSTSANLISTKIRTIAEMNKIITDSHNLDLRRMKELNMSKATEDANDDKRMMDMYAAFINTPVGSYGMAGPQFPSMQDMTMPTGLVRSVDITGDAGSKAVFDPGYEQWKQTMTPETARMILEKKNPNVQTVVVYDQTTNNKYFDAIDKSTGQSVPGYPLPDPYLLVDTYPNINNGTARNSNIDAVYPLVLTGAPSSLQDY